MDKVRLGRALGYGTRHLAKTVAAVAEAAASPEAQQPIPGARKSRTTPISAVPSSQGKVGSGSGEVLPRRRVSSISGSRVQHLRRSVWRPLAVFSGALWLRVTGTFFALIASTMGMAAWRQRSDLHAAAGPLAALHFWLFLLFATMFGYFAVSSFFRADSKERRAQNVH